MTLPHAPRIETARLVLRAHTRDDFDAYFDMWNDEDVLRYTIGEARSRQDAWMTLHRMLGGWQLLGYGFWIIADKATGILMGEGGFMDAMRPFTGHLRGIPETGYALLPTAHGRGIASEALGAMHDWFDAHRSEDESYALIDPANPASIRVAEKLGYVWSGEIDEGKEMTGLYRRKRLSHSTRTS